MGKDEVLHIRIDAERKARIEADAEARGVKVPGYVIDALDFYGGFDASFLKQIGGIAEKIKTTVPKVIQQLLVAYINIETVLIRLFGAGLRIYSRAFMFDDSGLIEGERHGELVQEGFTNDVRNIKEKLESAAASKQSLHISNEEAALLALIVASKQKDEEILKEA